MSAPDAEMTQHVRWAIRVALGIVRAQRAFHCQEDAIGEALLALSLAWRAYDDTRGDFQRFARKRVAGAVRRALKGDRDRRAAEVVFEGTEEFEAVVDAPGDPWARANQLAREVMDAIATTHQLAEAVARVDRGEEIAEEIARLGPEEMKLIDLKYRRDLSWEDVGSGLGIKERAARYRDAELRKKLGAALGKQRR
jgi:RNA polymerase sigma factor (sigma-70 family)